MRQLISDRNARALVMHLYLLVVLEVQVFRDDMMFTVEHNNGITAADVQKWSKGPTYAPSRKSTVLEFTASLISISI